MSLLYEELDAPSERQLREHLASCARCRAEWQHHRETAARLDAWPDVDVTLAPLRIGRSGPRDDTAPRRARRLAIRAAGWTALAASLLLLVAAGFLGVEIRRIEGGVRVTFGGGGASTTTSDLGPASIDEATLVQILEPAIRDAVLDEMEQRFEGILRAVVDEIADVARDQEEKRAVLARAVYLQREEDLRRTGEILRRVTFETAVRTGETHRMLEGIVEMVRTEEEPIEPRLR